MPGAAPDEMVKREMVTLLLCGSGVDDTSMQDLFYTWSNGSLVFNYYERL